VTSAPRSPPMKLNATIAGVGITRFMKYPDKGLKERG
jgi:hypothetical protein